MGKWVSVCLGECGCGGTHARTLKSSPASMIMSVSVSVSVSVVMSVSVSVSVRTANTLA